MNKALTLVFFVFIGSASFAQAPDTTSKQKATGTVYFMRATNLAMYMSTFAAFIDNELVCRLDDHKYSAHELKPGKHVFTMQAGGKKNRQKNQQVELNIEAGKTYYFEPQIETGLVYNVFIQEITESAAKRLMDKYKMKHQKTCLP